MYVCRYVKEAGLMDCQVLQVEPLNKAQERKQAEWEEVVTACFELPIAPIKVRGCLSGKIPECEKLLKTLEGYQDNGEFKKHDCLVLSAIHHYEGKKDFTMALLLKIEKSATYSYQGNWKQAYKLLVSVINSHLKVEYSDIIKARAYYLLVAHMRRKKEFRESKIDLLFKFLKRSRCLLRNYDSPEDWAELYQTFGCVWMDYMGLPLDKRNVAREEAMDCFCRAIYYSEQDPRERVQMKRQSYVHLKFAIIHLVCCSIFALAQENRSTLDDIKEAEKHLVVIKSKFGDTIPIATRMLLSKTQSDLCYRRGEYQLAKAQAEDAHNLALRYRFNTELNTLQERRDFYGKKLIHATRFRGFIIFFIFFVLFFVLIFTLKDPG